MTNKNCSAFIPPGVIEFARTVYSADYEGSNTAKTVIDKFMDIIDDSDGNDRVYLLEYVSAACDVALGLKDTRDYKKNMYEKIDFDRRDAINTAIESKNSEIKATNENKFSEIKSVDEKEKSLLKRFIPAGSIYVPLKSATLNIGSGLPEYLQWVPELVGSIVLVGADLNARYVARKDRRKIRDLTIVKNKEIRKKYSKQIKDISQNYIDAVSELETLTDEKNRERFDRAEEKMTNCYESCYGIDLRGVWDMLNQYRTSAEEFKSDNGKLTKEHLKRVDPIV
ncbi:MAG: hypothetical protein KJ697_03315 [Nanoarchaeota archaeon]|nr:hypothetical protein [Nanoarchaeota archaeon]